MNDRHCITCGIDLKDDGRCWNTNCVCYSNRILPSIDLYEDVSVCETCEGSGWIAKLYPSGHTEATCEDCLGTGES